MDDDIFADISENARERLLDSVKSDVRHCPWIEFQEKYGDKAVRARYEFLHGDSDNKNVAAMEQEAALDKVSAIAAAAIVARTRQSFKMLSDILETGASQTIRNRELGEISVDRGNEKEGLYHIIKRRNEAPENLSVNDITASIFLVCESAKHGTKLLNKKSNDNDVRYQLEEDAIIAIVAKRRYGQNEKFVLTGYMAYGKTQEATDAIRTVNATYGYTPEFSGLRKQVGAVVESLSLLYHASREKSTASTPLSEKGENLIQGVFMAEEQKQEDQKTTPEEQAFLNAMHQRKQIAESLKNGSHPCLPGKDGLVDTTPAVNLVSGKVYHGVNLLYLKDHQQRNGFASAEYVSSQALEKAKIFPKAGERGVTINWSEKNEQSGQWEQKSARLFNVAQLQKPQEMREYAAKEQAADAARLEAWRKQKYGADCQPLARQERKAGPVITCTSTEPERYLSQYFAAVSMGSTFKVEPKQGAEFSQKAQDAIWERGANGHTNPYALSKICTTASTLCKDVIRQAREPEKLTQELKQTQTRSRGM